MSNSAGNRSAPLSIRLTEAEKACLREKAAGMPLGTFIKRTVLDDAAAPRRVRQSPVRDGEALGRVLALLGQSNLASSFNQLAKHANAGTLYCDEPTRIRLNEACEHVTSMRLLLLQALGKEILAEVGASASSLSATFAASAGRPDAA